MKKILITLFSAVIAFAMTSCADELTYDQPVNKKPSITIQVNQSKATTRADYSGIGISVTEVTVSEGDVIGVYAVDKAGNIVSDNVAFTYDGKAWNAAADVPYDKSYSYYAYYPHVESPYKPDFSKKTANEIFAQFITDVDNKFHFDDQSTKEKFTACDLMVSELGVLSGKTTVSFSLYHKKSLAILTGEFAPFTKNTYAVGDKAYYMMKPSTPTVVAGFTLSAPGGKAVSKEAPYDSEVAKKYYTSQYLTFIPIEDSTFGFINSYVSYSLDNGKTWTELNYKNGTTPTIPAGNKIMWKKESNAHNPSYQTGIGTFTSSRPFNIQGNIMSLYSSDNFVNQTSIGVAGQRFKNLFANCKVRKAENLILPATELAEYCYDGMFNECAELTIAPELPATTLAYGCYHSMFYGCKSLTKAPELPATSLAGSCYREMLKGCTALTKAPELPATELAACCYDQMFMNCTSLTEAPELPATEVKQECYGGMFSGCTSLTTAPELPATTLGTHCYMSMFNNCTSLTAAPELPATKLQMYCYGGMFSGCTSLTTAPELPATTLADMCYKSMFQGCKSLSCVKAMAIYIGYRSCIKDWLNGVSNTGTFFKNAAAKWENSDAGIPEGWNVETYNP